MDEIERLAKLEAGQAEIMRALERVVESLQSTSGLDVRVARLEERNSLLMKLLYGAMGAGGAGVAGHLYNLVQAAGG